MLDWTWLAVYAAGESAAMVFSLSLSLSLSWSKAMLDLTRLHCSGSFWILLDWTRLD